MVANCRQNRSTSLFLAYKATTEVKCQGEDGTLMCKFLHKRLRESRLLAPSGRQGEFDTMHFIVQEGNTTGG